MSTWSDFRQEVFGEPYMVWHDGADFDPTPELVAALADGVRADDYPVRYHSSDTLTRWAGGGDELSSDDEVFPFILDEATSEQRDRASEVLVARVREHLGW